MCALCPQVSQQTSLAVSSRSETTLQLNPDTRLNSPSLLPFKPSVPTERASGRPANSEPCRSVPPPQTATAAFQSELVHTGQPLSNVPHRFHENLARVHRPEPRHSTSRTLNYTTFICHFRVNATILCGKCVAVFQKRSDCRPPRPQIPEVARHSAAVSRRASGRGAFKSDRGIHLDALSVSQLAVQPWAPTIPAHRQLLLQPGGRIILAGALLRTRPRTVRCLHPLQLRPLRRPTPKSTRPPV